MLMKVNLVRAFIAICFTFGLFDIFIKFVAQNNEFPTFDKGRGPEWQLFARGNSSSRGDKFLNILYDDQRISNISNKREMPVTMKSSLNLFKRFQEKVPRMKPRLDSERTTENAPTTETYLQNNNSPIEHISFLKVHMAGSTPLQLMFFRFGYERNLSIVLPSKGHYFTKSTHYPEPILPPKYGTHYDIVCNHACFNYSLYSSLMPDDTVYIAIVRDPYMQFLHSYYYYLRFFSFAYLKKIPNPAIENLIRFPEKYDEGRLTYTMNAMARDFGFQTNHFYDFTSKSGKSSATAYLESIAKIFDLVLVYEKYEESLILLKRRLNWPLKSILFMAEKDNYPEMRIDGTLLDAFKTRNKLDYLLYDYFSKLLNEKIRKGGRELVEETINFKLTLKTVRMWCDYTYFGKLTLPATRWSEKLEITSQDCDLMTKSEFEFIDLLKKGISDS